jgi:hypothetical protein
MFKAIANLLSRRDKPAPNPRQAVDDFRAKKRAEGLTEAEISAALVASRIATEAVFIANGWSDKAIDGMNWGYLFQFPPAPLPVRNYVIYPNNWREIQNNLRREGWSNHIIDNVLEGVGALQQRNAQPRGLLDLFEHVEPRGSRAESVARLLEQGYTKDEIIKISDARLNISGKLGLSRYPFIEEEGGIIFMFPEDKKPATRPPARLRLVADNPAPGKRS